MIRRAKSIERGRTFGRFLTTLQERQAEDGRDAEKDGVRNGIGATRRAPRPLLQVHVEGARLWGIEVSFLLAVARFVPCLRRAMTISNGGAANIGLAIPAAPRQGRREC